MNGWETLIGALIGVVAVPLFVWIISLINSKKIAEFYSNLLLKLFKGNVELADEVEESTGNKLIEIGNAIKAAHDSKKKET